MATFFTADTHFGDAPLVQRRRVIFGSVEAHDEALIARWNTVVGVADEVWHLGDFAAGASRAHCAAVFARLNGIKRLVRGNHDTNRVLELPWTEPPLESARITVKDTNGSAWRLYLSHYPHRSCRASGGKHAISMAIPMPAFQIRVVPATLGPMPATTVQSI